MKNRIVKISIDDLIVDPEGQSEMISRICHREIPMRVTGICQIGETLLLALEKKTSSDEVKYVFSSFCSVNSDEIIAEISTRFYSGYSLIGGFDVKLEKWGLFETHK